MNQQEEKVLQKVAKLLERGNHPGTPPEERESCLNMADQIMTKYAMDMAQVEAAMTVGERRAPIDKIFDGIIPQGDHAKDLQKMLHQLAATNRVRTVFLHGRSYDGSVGVHMFGLREDIVYVEMVWNNIFFDFHANLSPSWDDAAFGFDENVYRLVKAAYKWQQIAIIASSYGHGIKWPDGGRLKRAYHRHQKVLGEEQTPHTQSHRSYRESFSMSYAGRVSTRLSEMKREHDMASGRAGTGAELVLVNYRDQINGMVQDMYPKLRTDRDRRQIRNLDGMMAGVKAGDKVRLTKQDAMDGGRKGIGS